MILASVQSSFPEGQWLRFPPREVVERANQRIGDQLGGESSAAFAMPSPCSRSAIATCTGSYARRTMLAGRLHRGAHHGTQTLEAHRWVDRQMPRTGRELDQALRVVRDGASGAFSPRTRSISVARVVERDAGVVEDCAAIPFFSRSRPSSRCSVPTYVWLISRASLIANSSTFSRATCTEVWARSCSVSPS